MNSFAYRSTPPARLSGWLGIGAVVLLFAASVAMRLGDFRGTTGVPNLEATYHVLLTVRGLRELPIARSHLLPVVTLGGAGDKFVPWGATIPTATGEYVYTSFPPLGFVAPYAFFSLLRWAPSTQHLIAFNCVLGLASALSLFVLLLRVLVWSGYPRGMSAASAAAGTSLLIFSREALQSFGLVYWSQSFEELLLILQLMALFELWIRPRRGALVALCAVSFLSALTEWSGLVANVCITALLAFSGPAEKRALNVRMAGLVLLCTIIAVIGTAVQFVSALGFQQTVLALGQRFLARGAARTDSLSLLVGYANSFGLFLVLAVACASWMAFTERRPGLLAQSTLIPVLLLSASFPLIENAVLLQHASEFSFDRLKLAVPLAIIVSAALVFALASKNRFVATAILGATLLGARQNFLAYQSQKTAFSDWAPTTNTNQLLRDQVASAVDLKCAAIGSAATVRAYSNLLFDRAILENSTPAMLAAHARQVDACGTVFLEQEAVHTDLPRFTKATVTSLAGEQFIIVP